MMVVQRGRHVRIAQQQHKQQWLTSSLSVRLSTKCCLTNEMPTIETTILDTTWQRITDRLGLQMVSKVN